MHQFDEEKFLKGLRMTYPPMHEQHVREFYVSFAETCKLTWRVGNRSSISDGVFDHNGSSVVLGHL